MSAEDSAWNHLACFTWHRGRPDMSDAEARLEDLLALEGALRDLLREARPEVEAARPCRCRHR